MNIIYIPLDERPCNYLYPQYMIETRNDINIKVPSYDILGKKKRKADLNKIWHFINENACNSEIAVFSLEMIVYGGLLPSRLHHNTEEQLNIYVEKIRELKKKNPRLKIYLSALIMRTPKYNSSDEEPDYYEELGEKIFRRAWLIDKQNRSNIKKEEELEIEELNKVIPQDVILDYENRRKINLSINKKILELYKEGIVEFLVIPQDDSAEYGYTAMDQRELTEYIDNIGMFGKVLMYPGADEAGATLIAKAVSDLECRKTKFYPVFSSVLGPQIVPLYEDRPIMESLKSHVMAVGGKLVCDPEEADIILAINSPGKIMQESWDQFESRDITYSSYRNLIQFSNEIKSFVDRDKKVIIADVAYSNGGDYQLIKLLDSLKVLDKILSYKGWNTNCNTIGTTLAQGVLAKDATNLMIKKNVLYHLLEDAFYQSKVRVYVNNNILPDKDLNYFDLKDKGEEVSIAIKDLILAELEKTIVNSFKDINIKSIKVFNPWNRMFEIGIELEVE